MWISRKRFFEMVDRIRRLEDWRNYENEWTFNVYDDQTLKGFEQMHKSYPYSAMQIPPGNKVQVKEVVQQILDHLGLKLGYRVGTPPKPELRKQDKSK